MARKELADDSHVLRFVPKRHVHNWDQPEVDGAAFRLRPANKKRKAETELSLNWPKCLALSHLSDMDQVEEAKRLCRMRTRLEGSGFAEFIVGSAKSRVPLCVSLRIHNPPTRAGPRILRIALGWDFRCVMKPNTNLSGTSLLSV